MRDEFFDLISKYRRLYFDIKCHIKETLEQISIEVRVDSKLIAKESGEEEEAFYKAIQDIHMWEEGLKEERQRTEEFLRKRAI